MRIAVTYEDGKVFQHFGQTERFKVYDIENGEVKVATTISTNGNGHGALIGIVAALGVDALICGGIGGGAQAGLKDANIKIYGGVSGDADKAVEDFLAGKLGFDPDVQCNHHEHEHGGTCGEHGCGGHHHHHGA